MSVPEAERRAMAALFVGAVGLFKNPSSHRHAEQLGLKLEASKGLVDVLVIDHVERAAEG